MRKITAIVLLYTIAAMPAFAADGNAYPEPDASGTLGNTMFGEIRANVDRMSTFSLLELNDKFSLHGKLSIPRFNSGDEAGIQRNAVTYGLLGSMTGIGIPRMGIRFGWNRYLAGPNTSSNLYSLTAEVKF